MRVLIIEDENRTAKRLETQLSKYDPGIEVVAHTPSVTKTVTWLEQHQAPDLMFVDIHLEDDLAFELFNRISITTPVIFTTSYIEHIIRAFKVNSIDYLLKPIQFEELSNALEKFKSFQRYFTHRPEQLLNPAHKIDPLPYKERFMATVGTKIKSVAVSEIAYFFVQEKAVFLTTLADLHLPVNYSLDTLMQFLDPLKFFRVNRQYIISIASILSIQVYSPSKLKIELDPPARHEIMVSGDRISSFKEWLGK
jgi:two-component system, LytTR family, response regulator